MDRNKRKYYVGDPQIIARVRQYLSQQKNQQLVDVSHMSSELRRQYQDYGRKKANTFMIMVEKAYNVISNELKEEEPDVLPQIEQQYLIKQRKSEKRRNSSRDEGTLSSENEDYRVYKDTNSMNSMVSNLYKKTSVSKSPLLRGPDQSSKPASGTTLKCDGQPVFFIDKNQAASVVHNERQIDIADVINVVDKEDETASINEGEKSLKRKIGMEKTLKVFKRRPVEQKAVQLSRVTFSDIGGNEATLKEIVKLLVHMKHPEVFEKLGVTPPRGFLLHGPPGCGKTLLANAIAGELQLPFIKLAATEVVSGVSGESEQKLRELFDIAIGCAPCILFFDEIDAITPKRETASKDMERRIVAQLLSCMDDLATRASAHVLVIGATNRPDSLDPALRRAGRFDREISLGIPDEAARMKILHVLCKDLRLVSDFDFSNLAHRTPGFVGADLMALAREAAMTAVNRVFHDLESQKLQQNSTYAEMQMNLDVSMESPYGDGNLRQVHKEDDIKSVLSWLKDQPPLSDEQLEKLSINFGDFEHALKQVQPSAKREGFATIPDVTWDDIGALHDVREELQISVLAPMRYPQEFKALGLTNPPGILLAGPPGCGKTLLAKAVANESGINFISVKGPELLNMYVGESERAVRQVFQRARSSVPCVIFFDELDALCPRRSLSSESGASVRVVNQLLTEMDGLEERKQVFVMGATNRPDIIDPAILRPGRLDKIVYVGLPGPCDRLDILKTITKNGTKPVLNADVNLDEVANCEACCGFTGADLAALVREASVSVLKERMSHGLIASGGSMEVSRRHFDVALKRVKPSVSSKDQLIYQDLQDKTNTRDDT